MCSAEYFVVRLNMALGMTENVVFHLSTKYDIISGVSAGARTRTEGVGGLYGIQFHHGHIFALSL